MSVSSKNTTFVFSKKPENFSPVMEVAACYLDCNGKFLFLRRAVHKLEGGRWGVPAGKIEKGETSHQAVCREIFEETQIVLNQERLKFVAKLFLRNPKLDFIYHMYYLKTEKILDVILNNEHEAYRWLSKEEMKDFSFVSGAREALYRLKALLNHE